MKKVVQSLILSFALVISAPIQRSDAMVGGPVLAVAASIYGLAFLAPGILSGEAYDARQERNYGPYFSGSVILMLSGLLLLDSQTTPVTFGELKKNSEAKLKISREDRIVYNSELDEARVVGQNVAQDLLKTFGYDERPNMKKIADSANQKWKKVCDQGQLSEGTCRVLTAIRNQQLK